MSRMIISIEQSTAKMLPTEKARFLKDLYKAGVITKREYNILREETI